MAEMMKKLNALLDDAVADLKEDRDRTGPRDWGIHCASVRYFEGEVEGIRMAIEIVKKEAN